MQARKLTSFATASSGPGARVSSYFAISGWLGPPVDAAAAAVLPSPAHVEIFHIEAQGTVAASARCLESALHAPEVLPRWSLHYRLGSNQDIGAGKAEL